MAEEKTVEVTQEEAAKAWEDYVRGEINTILDIFLPEAIHGNFGVRYMRPASGIDPKTDKLIVDESKATGVQIFIEFDFADTVEFFDELPEESEPEHE